MEIFLYALIGLLAGVIVGYLIGRRQNYGNDPDETTATDLARAQGVIAQLEKRIIDTDRAREEEHERAVKNSALLEQTRELKAEVTRMQDRVNLFEEQRNKQMGTVEEQLRQSLAGSDALKKQTETLARAMSDNRMRGQWGEVQLERLIEEAGLKNLIDYVAQKGVQGGAMRPDITLKLPGGKHLAIDSKVPFDAYMEASAISDLASDEELSKRSELLEKHASHVRAHIKSLGEKKYWEGITSSPPFVIAYIPSESLISAALDADPTLLEYAFKQNVAIASPVSLFSVLKTVTFIWQQEASGEALANVVALGKSIYNRISVIAKHADSLRKSVEGLNDNFNKFAVSLESNLLTSAREANKLDEGQFAKVEIPEIPGIRKELHEFTKKELSGGVLEGEIIESEES